MQRYYVNSLIEGNELIANQDDLFHMKKVMRNHNGDQVVVIDCDGNNYLCLIEDIDKGVLRVGSKLDIDNELDVNITIAYALPKGDKFELVLQKTCELGVRRIIPLLTNRCVVKMDQQRFAKKKARYQKILKEATEQSIRNKIPILEDLQDLKSLQEYMCDYNLVAYEETAKIGSNNNLNQVASKLKPGSSIMIVVGSEGGFDEEEVAYLNSIGFSNCALGKRILRSETAPLYICSVIGFMREGR